MNKKRFIVALAAVILVALFTLGGTLAYLSGERAADNEVLLGNVHITLTEPRFVPNRPGTNEITGIYPGAVYPKDPTIENTGDAPCFVRADVTISGLEQLDAPPELLKLPLYEVRDGWFDGGDGYYYYTQRLTPGETAVLFDQITIPTAWQGDWGALVFDVTVQAEAIQTANNAAALAWPVQITAEGTLAPQ